MRFVFKGLSRFIVLEFHFLGFDLLFVLITLAEVIVVIWEHPMFLYPFSHRGATDLMTRVPLAQEEKLQ